MRTGVRLTYAASDQVNIIVGVNNGWDQLQDQNKQKTAELGVAFTPNKMFSLAVQGYSGVENTSATTHGRRDLIDAVGTYNATSQLTFILNVDWADQENAASVIDGTNIKAKWDGAALYGNYQISDPWAVSVRVEYFDDKDGYRTGVIQKWKEGTLTVAYLPSKEWEIRAEARMDKSDQSAFFKSDGVTTTDKQHSVGLEVLYKF